MQYPTTRLAAALAAADEPYSPKHPVVERLKDWVGAGRGCFLHPVEAKFILDVLTTIDDPMERTLVRDSSVDGEAFVYVRQNDDDTLWLTVDGTLIGITPTDRSGGVEIVVYRDGEDDPAHEAAL